MKNSSWSAFEPGARQWSWSPGCHFGDCHYIDANHWTKKRVERAWKKMEKWGLRPERLRLEWISAAEGIRFAQVMARMEELRATVTKKELAETPGIIRANYKKKEKKV